MTFTHGFIGWPGFGMFVGIVLGSGDDSGTGEVAGVRR